MSSKTPSDLAQSLNLLWGSHTKPGRSGLTTRRIVDAAIELCDDKGLEALSMRRVAEHLKVGTMSLYTYIPGKEELTDLMFDILMGQVYADVDEPSQQGGWRKAMQFVAQQNWKLYIAHPWLSEMLKPRPVLGPQVSLKYEAELRPLDGIGFTDVEMDSLLTAIMTYVHGAARSYSQLKKEQKNSAQTDQEWWLDRAPLLEKLMDSNRFPVASRVGQTVGEELQAVADPELSLRFSLEMLLNGADQLLTNRKQK